MIYESSDGFITSAVDTRHLKKAGYKNEEFIAVRA
jgi:hypothetical protein